MKNQVKKKCKKVINLMNEITKLRSQTKQDKMKENPKAKYLQNLQWGPFIIIKSRGVVGVPTNGDLLGEPVMSICLPED